jgi:hypothetical protein
LGGRTGFGIVYDPNITEYGIILEKSDIYGYLNNVMMRPYADKIRISLAWAHGCHDIGCRNPELLAFKEGRERGYFEFVEGRGIGFCRMARFFRQNLVMAGNFGFAVYKRSSYWPFKGFFWIYYLMPHFIKFGLWIGFCVDVFVCMNADECKNWDNSFSLRTRHMVSIFDFLW